MKRSLVIRGFALLALFLGFGGGCAGNGCSALKPLPTRPTPTGFPVDQQIEGGMQLRITKAGMDKVSKLVPALIDQSLSGGFCAMKQQTLIDIVGQKLKVCDAPEPRCGGQNGCAASVILNSKDRPFPNNVDDGKNKVTFSMADGPNPVLIADLALDVFIPLRISLSGWLVPDATCTLNVYDHHYKDRPTSDPTHIIAKIGMGIDSRTGQLTLRLADLQVANLNFGSDGCSVLGTVLDKVLDFVSSDFGGIVTNLLVDLLRPALNSFLQGLLPNPPGIAGTLSMGEQLASLGVPADSNLELFLVAGGYVGARKGGLNVGFIAGANSDRNQATRDATTTSEPSLCVPQRPAPALGSAPWNLPLNSVRKDHLLSPADPFNGLPDPVDAMGQQRDFAFGLSRTFLDLAGFHAYNSGALCMIAKPSPTGMTGFNAGKMVVLMPSLAELLENPGAPVVLVVRPEQPLRFIVGTGTDQDPLLHVAVEDLRLDLYTIIEERYVRIFTVAMDLNVGVNLTVTKGTGGRPAILPVISGVSRSTVATRLLNTDLLQEDPAQTAKLIGTFFDGVTGLLMGVLKPFDLPTFSGFGLDGLTIGRVHTNQDDFVAIYGTLLSQAGSGSMFAPQPGAPAPFETTSVDTEARVIDVTVPPADLIRDAVLAGESKVPGKVPSVTLALGGSARNDELEWQIRIDGGAWRSWSGDPRPTIVDPLFLAQGRHHLEVRARLHGDWHSEDETPSDVEVLIDSVPPVLHATGQGGEIRFGGVDNVSAPSSLRYSWATAGGWTARGVRDAMSYGEAWAAAPDGKLRVRAVDEAGNESITIVDLPELARFHGRTATPSGNCTCALGARRRGAGAAAVAFGLLLIGALRRRIR